MYPHNTPRGDVEPDVTVVLDNHPQYFSHWFKMSLPLPKRSSVLPLRSFHWSLGQWERNFRRGTSQEHATRMDNLELQVSMSEKGAGSGSMEDKHKTIRPSLPEPLLSSSVTDVLYDGSVTVDSGGKDSDECI